MNDHRKTWAQELYLSLVVAVSTLAVTYTVTVAGPAKHMTATEFVNAYMAAQMKPDPVLAKTFVGPDFEIIFGGGHKTKDPNDASAFNSRRYKWVKKRSERTETAAGSSPDETVVYSIGTLYGEWPDGTPFEGNRYIDRFVMKNGKIIQQQELNDSAEILLDRADIPENPLRTRK